ncbi:hypothetical protein FOZ62_023085, partial [Perkinsus olseni]
VNLPESEFSLTCAKEDGTAALRALGYKIRWTDLCPDIACCQLPGADTIAVYSKFPSTLTFMGPGAEWIRRTVIADLLTSKTERPVTFRDKAHGA